MRTLLVFGALLLLATPLAAASSALPPLFGDHVVGPCDLWTSQFDVGDSYRLTCVADGAQVIYFHQGQAGLRQECDYYVLGHDLFSCQAPLALA
jgi:hypothetical protein